MSWLNLRIRLRPESRCTLCASVAPGTDFPLGCVRITTAHALAMLTREVSTVFEAV